MYPYTNTNPSQITVTQIAWGSITLGQIIGHGGYGEVYRATWQNMEVAVKQLHLKTIPEHLQKDFENETQIMAQCQYSHIVKLHGACIEVGHYAIVMEYMPIGSLYQVLQNKSIELSWTIRYEIAIDVGKGLHFLHANNILHRDFKSLNILLDNQYRAKITDFGLSKIKLESSSTSSKTNKTGTVRWRAPESFKRGFKAAMSTDIYSYGVVLWEITSRTIPYEEAQDEITVMGFIKDGEQETIPADTPAAYAAVIQQTWQSAEKRPLAHEIIVALKKSKLPTTVPIKKFTLEDLTTVWGRKPTPTTQPVFQVVSAKIEGCAIGACFKPQDKPYSVDWIGKLGYRSLTGDTAPQLALYSLARRGSALEAMLEKIAADVYFYLSEGYYHVPKTRLAELPIKNHFTEQHALTQDLYKEINQGRVPPIDDGVYVLSKRVEGYDNLSELKHCMLGDEQGDFLSFLNQGKLPEWVIIAGKKLPLLGLMEILAAARLLADTDVLGGGGKNAGYVKEYDITGATVAVRAVKIDPGYAFNFRGHENQFFQSIHPYAHASNLLKQDKRNLQYGNNAPALLWTNLTSLQQQQFIYALERGLRALRNTATITKIIARNAFIQTPKQRALPPINEMFGNANSLEENLVWQETAYTGELKILRQLLDLHINQMAITTTTANTSMASSSQFHQVMLSWQVELGSLIPNFLEPLSIEQVTQLNLTTTQEEALKAWLFSFVEGSKTNAALAPKAAKAITTLNSMGVAFMGKYGNLAGINIPGADLSGGIFPCTYLYGANLEGVNLTGAYLAHTDFTNANLLNVCFGEFPPKADKNPYGHGACYSPNKRYLAIGEYYDSYNHVLLFVKQGENYKKIANFQGHTRSVYDVAFSPDSKVLASGSGDKTIRLWEVETQRLITVLQCADEITCIAYSPNGNLLAAGNHNKTIYLWDINTQKYWLLSGHTEGVRSVVFSPNGKLLASGSYDKMIYLWDVDAKKRVGALPGHTKGVTSIAFSPDGKRLVSGSWDKTIRLWDIDERKCWVLAGYTYENIVENVAFSPNGKHLISEDNYNSVAKNPVVRLWNINTQQSSIELQGHKCLIQSVAINSDNKHLASGSFDKTICLWDAETKKLLIKLQGHSNGVLSITFSPNGNYLASGSHDKTIYLWNINAQKYWLLPGHAEGVTCVAFSPNGKLLASGSYDKIIYLWDVDAKKIVLALPGHTEGVTSIAFSPDGKRLVSGSWDKTIRLWDIDEKKCWALTGHTGGIRGVAFNPNGKMLASGGDDSLRLWDANTGKCFAEMKGHNGVIESVAFSPDGKCLASGSWDNTIRLWNVYTGNCLVEMKGHENGVRSIAFSSDGKTLISGGFDCALFLWQKAEPAQQENWVVTHRFANSFVLLADNAYLKGVTISETNLKLLKQRGANDDKTPNYVYNPHLFWAKSAAAKAVAPLVTPQTLPYRYNNVAYSVKLIQTIYRSCLYNSPGKKFIYNNSLVNSSLQIIYSGIDSLLKQQGETI